MNKLRPLCVVCVWGEDKRERDSEGEGEGGGREGEERERRESRERGTNYSIRWID